MGRFYEAVKELFSLLGYSVCRRSEISHYEEFYASMLYSYLQGMGFELRVEEETIRDRVDKVMMIKEKNIVNCELKRS